MHSSTRRDSRWTKWSLKKSVLLFDGVDVITTFTCSRQEHKNKQTHVLIVLIEQMRCTVRCAWSKERERVSLFLSCPASDDVSVSIISILGWVLLVGRCAHMIGAFDS